MAQELLDLTHILDDPKTANYVAVVAIVLCVVGTVLLARRLALVSALADINLPSVTIQIRLSPVIIHRQQVLFNTLVFFALSWAALVPLYNGSDSKAEEIRSFLPAYQGLLFALAGGSLRRYCLVRREQINVPGIDTLNIQVLRGLYAVVIAVIVSTRYQLPSTNIPLPTALIVGTFFDAVGYYLIVQGSAELTRSGNTPSQELNFLGLRLPISNSKVWCWLTAATVLYFVFDLKYGIEGVLRSIGKIHYDSLTPPLTWIFALLKLNLCAPFLLIIKDEADYLAGRKPIPESGPNKMESPSEVNAQAPETLPIGARTASSSVHIPLPFATAAIGLFLSYIFPLRIAPVQATVIGFGLGILLLYAAGRFEGKSGTRRGRTI